MHGVTVKFMNKDFIPWSYLIIVAKDYQNLREGTEKITYPCALRSSYRRLLAQSLSHRCTQKELHTILTHVRWVHSLPRITASHHLYTGGGAKKRPVLFQLCWILGTHSYTFTPMYIQGVSRLVDITAGGDFLGLCDQKSSYKHVSYFGRLRSYDRLKLGIEGNDYWQ